MKIALIGQKGIPATHGGVERHVEELGARLAGQGHDVIVFTRSRYAGRRLREHRGMRLVRLPTIHSKHLEAMVHSILASFVICAGGYDVVHYHAIGPCLASPIARLRGRRIVATIHGQDWRRAKWGRAASAVLRLGEWMALRVPDATISVSESLAKDYRAQTGIGVRYIPNGVAIDPGDDIAVLEEFGLADRAYILFAGRLVAEKGAHYLLEAHRRACAELPLVIAGDSSHSDEYAAALRSTAGEQVVFTGFQYGARLAALIRHAGLFVLPSDVEGLPIALLEALAYGAPVLASDIPPNVEVLGDGGRYFSAGDVDDLSRALNESLAVLPTLWRQAVPLAARTARRYDWDRVAEATADLYACL